MRYESHFYTQKMFTTKNRKYQYLNYFKLLIVGHNARYDSLDLLLSKYIQFTIIHTKLSEKHVC